MSNKKRFILFLVLILSLNSFWYNRVEASNISQTTITGHILPSLIRVSAPAKIVFDIDPNTDYDKQFISSAIAITNNSNAPVKVKINSGANNFTQAGSSLWKPIDVLPEAYDWNNIGTAKSENYLALGIKASGKGWRSNTRDSALYVKEQNDSNTSIDFGEIDSHSSAQMELVCCHGQSFGSEKECTYTIIWTFSLGE